MTRATRAAVWMVVVAMAAAPLLATAAQACSACCCPPAPCHDRPVECETSLVPMPCGDEATRAVPTVAKRAPEPPPFHAAIPAASRPVADLWSVRTRTGSGDFAAAGAALRLSVVLRL